VTGRHSDGKHRRSIGSTRSLITVVAVFVILGMVAVFARAAFQADTRSASPSGHPLRSKGASEVASQTPASSPSASPLIETGKLVIHGAGDVSLDPTFVTTYKTHGYAWAWTGLNGLFKHDDLTVVNLECAVSKLGTPVPKTFNFRGDVAALPAMRAAGVEVANMANNHSYDYGPDALLDMRKNLGDNNIAAVGAGKDPQQALAPALFTIKGWRIAVVGFDKVVDPAPQAVAAKGHPGTAAGHDENAMVGAVKAAAGQADIVIVDIHWGVELDNQPRAADVALAHKLVDAGADVIFGGHSHRLQPLEMYRGRPIFYSLANFVWPNFSTAGATTAVAEVEVSPQGKFTAHLIPAFIESSGHPVLKGT
jgi:poly-gamma-glutamate capsule biosynthesis protein CapA/YwtB (metallophosphatase superfamily)